MKNLTELSKKIFQANKEKGFWVEPWDVGEIFMLIVSKAGEAMEAHRKGMFADLAEYEKSAKEIGGFDESIFKHFIKDSFQDEVADIVIRCLGFAGFKNIDLSEYSGEFTEPDFATKTNNIGRQLLKITDLIVSSFNYFDDGDDYFGSVALCDAISKCYAVAEKNGIDLDRHIELKLLYNQTRPYKHGKLY